MDTAGFADLLEPITHDGFLAGTAVLTTITLVAGALAVRRILPRNERDETLPWTEDGPR
jgi:hypothetical protein